MKHSVLYFLSICFLAIISCKGQHSESTPTKEIITVENSPLEMMVNDYVNKEFPNWLDSTRLDGDTLFLHAYFTRYDGDSYIHLIDSTTNLDVIASVGGAMNRMVYPEYGPLAPPPPALLPGEKQTIQDFEDYVKDINRMEQDIYGKVTVAPSFSNNDEKLKYYSDKSNALHRAIDSLYFLNPALIGYTYFGPVQVIILADPKVDQNLITPFLKDVNVMDLRPRYISHKKNEKDIDCFGWGRFNVYSIKSAGQFKHVGGFLID